MVSYLKLSAHKEQPNDLQFEYVYKKWIPVAPCFRFFLITELNKM